MKNIFYCLFAAALLFSCSDDENNESIRLTGNTETSQVVYADETKGFITKIMVKREADEANSETNMTHIINYKN